MQQWLRNIALVTGLLVSYAATSGVTQSGVTQCDRLATHPDDPDRNTAGLEHEEVNLGAAEVACRAAVAADPRRAREHYHLARVLYYSGKIEEGMKELTIAADAGYRQAIFVLGYIYADGKVKHDDCRAGTLFLRGVALEHPWSGAHLVEKALAGRFANCAFKLSDDDLESAMHLAEEHVTVAASAGRIENLRTRLNQQRATTAVGSTQ